MHRGWQHPRGVLACCRNAIVHRERWSAPRSKTGAPCGDRHSAARGHSDLELRALRHGQRIRLRRSVREPTAGHNPRQRTPIEWIGRCIYSNDTQPLPLRQVLQFNRGAKKATNLPCCNKVQHSHGQQPRSHTHQCPANNLCQTFAFLLLSLSRRRDLVTKPAG